MVGVFDQVGFMTELEKRIGYRFKDVSLLEAALVTPACRMERPEIEDNQRLEFLGDAVFGLLSADAVFDAYPWEQEGKLTVRRTHLVSTSALIDAANRLGLGEFLKEINGETELLIDTAEVIRTSREVLTIQAAADAR